MLLFPNSSLEIIYCGINLLAQLTLITSPSEKEILVGKISTDMIKLYFCYNQLVKKHIDKKSIKMCM